MIELSQEEKDRIRAELQYRVAVLGESGAAPGAGKKLSAFLAHPIIVTVIGGMLVASVGAWLQNRYVREQAISARQMQVQDKKLSIAASLPANLYKDIALLGNRSYLRLDLEGWKRNKSYVAHLGRTREEVMKIYGTLTDEFAKSPRQAPLLAEARAWFCKPDVLDAAGKLAQEFSALEKIAASELTEKRVQEFGDKAEALLSKLISAMVNEVRESTQCHGAPSMI